MNQARSFIEKAPDFLGDVNEGSFKSFEPTAILIKLTRITLKNGKISRVGDYFMRPIDLRMRGDATRLKPLAHFSVLSYMLHPGDAKSREQFMAKIAEETGEISPRRAPLSHEEAIRNLHLHRNKGAQAGFITLTQIQLHRENSNSSLNNAIKIIQEAQPDWNSQGNTDDWRRPQPYQYLPGARQTIIKNVREYRGSQFLWAAFIHNLEHEHVEPFWLVSLDNLPKFIGHAEIFAEFYKKLPVQRRGPRPKDVFKERIRFKIPQQLVIRPNITALPLPDEWRAAT